MLKVKHLALLCAVPLVLFSCKSTPKEEPKLPAEEPAVEQEAEETPATEDTNDYSTDINALLDAVKESRQKAIESGAKNANPAAFAAAETEFAAHQAAVAAGNGNDLLPVLKDLNNRYIGLDRFAAAVAKKNRIDQLGYASYDKVGYDAGCSLCEELLKPESSITLGSAWNKKAAECDDDFAGVLDAAFRSLAKDERVLAFKAKKDADSVKASVSRKPQYEKGVDFFRKGDSQYVTGNPEGSLNSYTEAKNIFINLYEEIFQARAKAQAAIEEAKRRVEASELAAAKADAEVPLEDDEVEGIESEDTVLLEEDDFSAAEESFSQDVEVIEETLGDM